LQFNGTRGMRAAIGGDAQAISSMLPIPSARAKNSGNGHVASMRTLPKEDSLAASPGNVRKVRRRVPKPHEQRIRARSHYRRLLRPRDRTAKLGRPRAASVSGRSFKIPGIRTQRNVCRARTYFRKCAFSCNGKDDDGNGICDDGDRAARLAVGTPGGPWWQHGGKPAFGDTCAAENTRGGWGSRGGGGLAALVSPGSRGLQKVRQ